MDDSSPVTIRQIDADRLNPGGTPLRLEAAMLDWAGTVVGFGSFVPTQVFVETFAEFGVTIALDEARGLMGLDKWGHIRTLYNDDAVAARFSLAHDRTPIDDDVAAIHNRFMPLQIEKVDAHSAMIPGTLGTVTILCEAGSKIGTYSSCPRVVMNRIVDSAAKVGYTPDCVIAHDEMPRARPWSAQILRYVVDLAIDDVAICMKVNNIVPSIEKGRHAGMWTVALSMSGDALGLPYEQYTALFADGRVHHRVVISAGFVACRPHYGIDTTVDLSEIVADINHRLTYGECPQRV